MSDPFAPSLADMIAEADREVVLRRGVYARQVNAGKLREDVANRRIAVMEAIAAKLRTCTDA